MKSALIQTIIQTILNLTGHQFPTPADVNLLEQYAKDSQSQSLGPNEIFVQNDAVFTRLADWKPQPADNRLDALTSRQANEILMDAMANPVIARPQSKRYDPQGNIGFCFGRAMWTHLELLRRGVNKHSIYKAFVVGDMKYEGITWQFHVATMVRSDKGEWWILDPEFGRLMDLKEWFKYNQKLSSDQKLRLYVTEANKFGASADEYESKALADQWYNSYFKDMLSFFREESRSGRDHFGDAPQCRALFSSH